MSYYTPSSRHGHRSSNAAMYPYPATPAHYDNNALRRYNSAGTGGYYGTPAYNPAQLAPTQAFYVAPSSHGSGGHRHRSSSRHRSSGGGHHHGHRSSSHHGHHTRSHSAVARPRYSSNAYADSGKARYYTGNTSHHRPSTYSTGPSLADRIRSFFGFRHHHRYVDARTGREVDARGRPVYRV